MNTRQYAVITANDGIGGWEFDVPIESVLKLESDISSHVMEDNSTITDHVVTKPRTMTFRGIVGELVMTPARLKETMPPMSSRLVDLKELENDLAFQQAQQTEKLLASRKADFSELRAALPSPASAGYRQKEVLGRLTALWRDKSIVSVSTPWEYLETCMIESVSYSQDDTTVYASEVEITVKEVRFATVRKTIVTQDALNIYAMQSTVQSDNGNVQGVEKRDASLLAMWADPVINIATGGAK